MAQILNIIDRKDELGPSRLEHFELREGGNISSEIVIQHDHITPYCIDAPSRRLIFADLPPDIDLTDVPFVYVAQHDHATRLIAVPFDDLADLANQVTAPQKLILIYSTGRAGSTLMSQILNQVEGVRSFSEPDMFLNLVPIAYHADDRLEVDDLLQHCVKLFTYPYADQTVAIKFRAECIDIADLFHHAFPDSRNLFMYRDAIQWASSWYRINIKRGKLTRRTVEQARTGTTLFTGRSRHFDQFIPDDAETIDFALGTMGRYIFYLEAYFRHVEQDVPFFALRYQDLNTHREVMLHKLFDYLELPDDELNSALQGFERDSQAGTILGREHDTGNRQSLPDAQIQRIRDLLEEHPLHLTPDTILPHTALP